jgi:hypothetical protein
VVGGRLLQEDSRITIQQGWKTTAFLLLNDISAFCHHIDRIKDVFSEFSSLFLAFAKVQHNGVKIRDLPCPLDYIPFDILDFMSNQLENPISDDAYQRRVRR